MPSHFAVSTNWRINAFLVYIATFFPRVCLRKACSQQRCAQHLLSYLSDAAWDWYHQHIIGHHNYTNIPGLDPDVSICNALRDASLVSLRTALTLRSYVTSPKNSNDFTLHGPGVQSMKSRLLSLSFLAHYSIAIPVLSTVNSALTYD